MIKLGIISTSLVQGRAFVGCVNGFVDSVFRCVLVPPLAGAGRSPLPPGAIIPPAGAAPGAVARGTAKDPILV